MNDTLLSVSKLNKGYGALQVLSDISLDIRQGEFIAMLGPSGCGKTTLLRCIAGFDTADSGTIHIGGEEVSRRPPNKRPLNTVFQNYALFPHMSILDNVAYGPKRQGKSRAEARELAHEALKLVGLAEHGARFSHQLSGGQQQRVALARALVNRPRLLLLDEPLSALDLKLRKRMQIELKHLQEQLGIAFVFVTHDQEEAMTMADRIVVMNSGRIEQAGPGVEIYRSPSTRFVADFIGDANIIDCTPVNDDVLQPAIGSHSVHWPTSAGGDQRYSAILRPEQVGLFEHPQEGHSEADGIVEDVVDIGVHRTVMVRVGTSVIACRKLESSRDYSRGQPVKVGFHTHDLHIVSR